MEKSIKPYLRIYFVCLRFFRIVPRKIGMWRLSELSKVCVNLVVADNLQPKILVVFTAFAYGKIYAKDVWGHDLS